jgi:hypothetical protein
MFLTLFSSFVSAATGIVASSVWPKDDGAKAYTKTSDKINVIFPNNEAVKAGTGSVRLSDDKGLVRVISAADSRISYAKGDTVVIDFTADQKELTTYSVVVDNDAFKTVSSGAIATVPSWSYTVGDYTAPTLKSVSPVKGSNVSRSISLVVTFTDASNIALGSGNVIVYKADGNVWDLIPVKNNANVVVDATAKTLTVSNVRALEDLTSYVVTVDAGVVTDAGNRADGKKNSFAGLSDRTVWTFTSKDFTVPAFATGYPKISGITNKSANLVVKTTESGSLYFKNFSTEQTINEALLTSLTSVTPVSVTAGTEVTKATSSTDLTKSTDYFVYLVTKNSDVAPTKDDIVGPIKYTTIEKDAPTLADIYYYKGTTLGTYSGFHPTLIDQATTKIVLDFNETVSVGAGSIVIYKKSDNSIYTQIDASAITIDETDSSKAIATLSKSFENDADYYAFIPSSLFADKYNNFFGGLTKTTDWTFSSNDIIAPTVVAYTPAQGTSKVAVNSKVVVVFSEVIDFPGSGTASSTLFNLNVSGSDKDYTYVHSTNNNAYSTVTITPKSVFNSLDVVTLTVSGDVADLAGNKLGLSQGASFVVKDTEGPKISAFVPAKTEKLLPTDNIVIKLDEPIYLLGGTAITASNLYTIITLKENSKDGVNVAATYSISDDKKVITITPKTPWVSPSGKYYVAISSDIQDATGNKCLDDLSTRINTYDVKDITPATVSIDLAGKTDVAVNSSITLSFKEGDDLDKDALKYLLYGGATIDNPKLYSIGAMDQVIVLKKGDANGENVPFDVTSVDGKVFVVTPKTNFDGAKTYYVGIGASTTDQSDNINIANYTTFTTKYVDAPKVVSLSPSTDQTEVGTSSSIVVTFNTKVKFTGSITVVDQDSNPVVTTLSSGDGTTVLTFKHADAFSSNSTYTVTIPKGNVKNATTSEELAKDLVWSFSTVDKKFADFTLSPEGIYNDDTHEGTAELDSPLTIKVKEKVVAGVGNIYVKNATTDLLIEQIASTSSKVSIDYNTSTKISTIEITPSANFVYGTNYYIEIDKGAFVDAYSNAIPSIVGKTSDGAGVGSWTFGAVNPDLKVVSVSPYKVENVATDAEMVITFNRPIVKGTSSQVGFDEYNFAGTTLKQSVRYGITSSNLVVSGNTLTIKHADKLFTSSSKVYVILENLAVKASTKTSSSTALTLGDNQYFFVGDNLPPVATISPEWSAKDKNYSAVTTKIAISFNEDILNAVTGVALTNDNVSFSGGIIKIYDGSSNAIDFVGTVSGRLITLTPTSSLKESSTYTVTISAGKIKDTSSHNMDEVSAIFKTVDSTLPTIALTLNSGDNKLTASGISVNDANPGYFYYILKKASEAAPTLADVKNLGEKIDITSASDNPTGAIISKNITNIVFGNLDAGTSYVLYYFSEDARGNVTTLKTATKSTNDTVSPLLVSTVPVNGATAVDVNTAGKNIVLTFNEDVKINPTSVAGKIYFKDKATNSLIATLDQSALVANASSKSIDIVLKSNFPASLPATTVYVEVDGGLILDASGNAFDGFTGASQLYFTTEDNLVPSVKEYTFTGDDASHVVLNSNFGIVFSEDVAAGSANAILYAGTVTSTNTAVEVFKGSEVTISGNIVTLNPTYDLKNSQDYILEVQQGFVKDKSGNANKNLASLFTFKTDVNVAPYVKSISPDEFDDQNKSLLTSITIDFNENVYLPIAGIKKSLGLLTNGDLGSQISLKTASGVVVPITIAANGQKSITIAVNDEDLDHLTSYVLTVSGFVDSDNTAMESTTFKYTTGDGQYPVATFSPADKEKNVDASSILTLTFDENIYRDAKLYNGKLFYSIFDNTNVDEVVTFVDELGNPVAFDAKFNGTNKITITPTKALTSGATYTYGFAKDEISDINGNKSPLKTVTFTVKDTDKPTYKLDLVNVSPVPNATSVSADAKVWIKFSDPIVVGGGVINIRYEDGTLFETISGSKLSVNADTLFVSHKNFDSNKDYFVEIGEGVVTDKAGNTNVAMLDPTPDNGWVFTTKDTFDLTAIASPVGENTSRTVSLALAFNKVPQLGSGYLSVYKSNGTAVYHLPVSGAVVSGVTATFSTIALDADQAYYARIDKGAFVAKNNNDVVYAGIADNSWTFSTVNNIKPVVKTLTPADNSTAVSQYSEFSILFDRTIALGTGSIQLRKVVDGTILQSISVADAKISDKTLTFKFANTLPANTELYIIVPAGAVINTEVTADAFAGILDTYSWNFTTSTDNTAPTVTVTDPVAPIAKVFNVGLLFSEPVTGVASGITVTNGTFVVSGSGAQYSVTVTSDEQKVVTIVLANTITDLASPANAFAGKTLSYTTADLTAPKVVATTPTGTLTDNHPTLVVTFDENVVFGAGKLNIYKKSDNTLALAVPVTASMVSGKVATVTYTYDATLKNGLDRNTDYYVLADAGLVKDVAGNAFAGITATTTWTFKTGDFATITDPDVNNSLEFKVYPNPFVDYVTVSNASELSKVVVSNIAGQVVKEVVYPDGTIQLNELHSGVYFVALYKDGKVVSTVKLLKR